MIRRYKNMLVAAAAMLSASVAAPVVPQRLQHEAAPQLQGLQSCQPGMTFSDCNLLIAASSKDEDWTAAGGAMRGLDK